MSTARIHLHDDAQKISLECSELDMDGLGQEAEAELRKLERQLPIMGRARQTYSMESQEVIFRQLKEIHKLQEEHTDLTRTLRVSERPLLRLRDSEATGHLHSMLVFQDSIGEQLDKEKKTLEHLKKEILRMERKLADQCFGQRSRGYQMQRASGVLENKLDMHDIRFNKLMATNRQLREDLKTLQIERKHFIHLHSRMEKELNDIQRNIKDLMEDSTAAFGARIEAQCKTDMLKEKAVIDLAQHRAEMSKLKRVLSHDHRLNTFISTKSTERASTEENRGQSCKQVLEDECRIDLLEDAFGKIQSLTGESDLNKLVGTFIQDEGKNFALLNYVNEQNNEIETLMGQIKQIHQEINKNNMEWQRQQNEHYALLQNIRAEKQSVEVQTQGYEQRIASEDKILDQIKTGIDDVFRKIGCDRTGMEDKLGSSMCIRNDTIMTFLELVDQRTDELLTVRAYLHSRDLEHDCNRTETARHLLGQNPLLTLQHVTVEPPVIRDEGKFPATGEVKPLSKEELYQYVNNKLLQKTARPEIEVSQTSVLHGTRKSSCLIRKSNA